jgi:hypothetical protein
MIRSCNIPPLLNRICDDTIHSAFLVTRDGALLGASNCSNTTRSEDPEAIAALLADIGVDYQRLGEDFAAVDANPRSKSHMKCLLIELELGLVGVAGCSEMDSLVIVVGKANTPPGLVKAKLEALADYVQESLLQAS